MEQIIDSLYKWGHDNLISFLNYLDFYFAAAYISYLAGIKYTKQLNWIKYLSAKINTTKYTDTIFALILILIFCIFRIAGKKVFDADYLGGLLMTALVFVSCGILLLKFFQKRITKSDSKLPNH